MQMDQQTLDQIAQIESAFDEVLLPGLNPIRASVIFNCIMAWSDLTIDRVRALVVYIPDAKLDDCGVEALRTAGHNDILQFLIQEQKLSPFLAPTVNSFQNPRR
jgi:hypothetical protein